MSDLGGIRGLTGEEVRERMKAGLSNEAVSSNTRSIKDIIRDNTLTYFNFIFLILAILVVISGKFNELLFAFVIVANTAIGIIQEIHSKNVLDKLSLLNSPKITVIRDGERRSISSEKLVQDDIFELERGAQIPADATVVKGSVVVNESLLTGEADEIDKGESSQLLSGSFVVNGRCLARADRVGRDSYASKLTMAATRQKKGETSQMMKSLNNILKFIGIIIIPIGIIMFIQSYKYNNMGFQNSISAVVASLTGMIPEGLYLLTSVALAVSAIRLAQKKVLVHNLRCIETLARVDCLCVDKTGTITEPDMLVCGILPINEEDRAGIEKRLADFAHSFEGENETMKAIQARFKNRGMARAKSIFPFSSKLKYSGVEFSDGTYVLGAPEFVLRDTYGSHKEAVEAEAALGRRVMAFAKYDGRLSGGALTAKAELICFISLENPIREGAKETFEYFAKQGVQIKVISGDNPLTVSRIAKEAGISGSEAYIDARKLTSKEDIYEAVEKYNVFGRVVPEQKKALVRALKSRGRTVAMTGDGVNDILALNEADCSIAMASGSDACSKAAQLVLLDSDFTKMPSVVAEGRRVVNNVQRTASLYLAKNIFSLLLAIFSMSLLLHFPLTPSQISLISMFTIGIPSFILALEPNTEMIRGRFIPNVLLKALPAALTNFIVVGGLVLFCLEFELSAESLSTACTILVAIVGFMIIYYITRPLKLHHWIMIAALVGCWLYAMIFISHFFEITALTRKIAMLMILFAVAVIPLMQYFSRLFDYIYNRLNKR